MTYPGLAFLGNLGWVELLIILFILLVLAAPGIIAIAIVLTMSQRKKDGVRGDPP